jgi:hypothetical protein
VKSSAPSPFAPRALAGGGVEGVEARVQDHAGSERDVLGRDAQLAGLGYGVRGGHDDAVHVRVHPEIGREVREVRHHDQDGVRGHARWRASARTPLKFGSERHDHGRPRESWP